ncbi:hypothetical protein ASPACDRAFT_110164 [Aspergillus aculeatus ATCC 16872]|uniref:Zn(2)-C6 fungal-type domain-containing protein n=1 Tax=Aspergillus aculeatus (strain ATCC 16872 / CBS 172.66 / WB 5094) TaxID=690307 RepID=A0A1L9X9C5_ASPA1|nr:uncharacterized protein ASPACDRAFT_110164 [Aspergillus aculeatus ATCC 16872]OJK05037.1 hypothetical protein ASPACDRAFT_110164 [Aspergillus aculeatus ATCC 16872]
MTKGCYTCRRRRIVCDNGLPTCRKCRDAGKECLGYQKPLVWVKGGVASRGKMMGRSYDDVVKSASSARQGNDSSSSSPASTASPDTIGPALPRDTISFELPHESNDLAMTGAEDYDQSLVIQRSPQLLDSVPAPWGLVDPLFKDLDSFSRQYIIHFNQYLANYLTLYSNGQNPFRDLTPLVGDSSLLAHVLSALGALHYAILANEDFSPGPWSVENAAAGTLLSSEDVEKAVIGSLSRRPASKVYEHFLGFKQRALQRLSQDIQDPVMRHDNRTLAAIMLLALMDAIESGDGAWKYHLEGAKKLLKGRQEGIHPDGPATQRLFSWLDDFAIDGILIIQLMGSTLARPGSLTRPFYTSNMGPAVLKRLEETSWVGCPGYLLEVIFLIHAGLYMEHDDSQGPHDNNQPSSPPHLPQMVFTSPHLSAHANPLQSPAALLAHIQAFDPAAWAESMQSFLHLPDLSMRTALATVYQAAVYLYASRALSRPRLAANPSSPPRHFGLPADHGAVTDLLIRQIALIPVADPHFKCLIWPTFIAGAECADPALRPFLLDKLRALYYDITSVNVRNAAWVLSLMWRKRDQRVEERRQRKNLRRRQQRQQQADSFSANFWASEANAPDPTNPFTTNPNTGTNDHDNVYNDEEDVDDDEDDDDDDGDFDWIQELDASRIDWLFI